MNDKVKDIYEQMFAPDPIPAGVEKLFDRTSLFASRIDARQMSGTELAVIAACATLNHSTVEMHTASTSYPGTIDTSPRPSAQAKEVEPDEDNPKSDYPEEPAPTNGPTGVMDAPGRGRPKGKRRPLSVTKMSHMTLAELRLHAQEFYQWRVPSNYTKKQVITVLQTREPIRP